jgi:AcrR family transcriptional regulator
LLVARTINPRTYAAKRAAILHATQQLVFSKGFERMTVQDVLDELGMSIGAFYHYFDSKRALLDGLIQSMLDDMVQVLLPVVHDPHLLATEKLQRYFATMFRWRTDHRDALQALVQVWYADENAPVRQRLRSVMLARLSALLTEILQQGITEGVLTAPYPAELARVLVSLRMGLSETLGEVLAASTPERDQRARVAGIVAVYTEAIERTLGLPRASLTLTDADVVAAWLSNSANERSLP